MNQVNYDGELSREGRKREPDIAEWGEMERNEGKERKQRGW
jgi:hypothetical protein